MKRDKTMIDDIKRVESETMSTAGREKYKIADTGDATLCTNSGAIKLKQVLYVSTLHYNLWESHRKWSHCSIFGHQVLDLCEPTLERAVSYGNERL